MNAIAARCAAANDILQVISQTGRRHFWSAAYERRSRFDLDHVNSVWYIDAGTGLKLHPLAGRWTGFTGGITAKSVIFALAEFVERGKLVPASVFQADFGYGSAMEEVRREVGKSGAVENS